MDASKKKISLKWGRVEIHTNFQYLNFERLVEKKKGQITACFACGRVGGRIEMHLAH